MFGNNMLAVVMYGSEKVLGQGYDPIAYIDEVMIFDVGDIPDGDLSMSDSSD